MSLPWLSVIHDKNNHLGKITVIITPALIRNYSNKYLYNLLFVKKFMVNNVKLITFEIFNVFCKEKPGSF